MSALVIRVEERHDAAEPPHNALTGISIDYHFEDLQKGDVLPGVAPMALRMVRRVIDSILGQPVDDDDNYDPSSALIN